jgi:predicted Zn-dependent protease
MNNLAMLYADHLNDLDRALKLARDARALGPESPEIADTVGWIMIKRKEYAPALEILAEAVAKMGDNPEIQYHFGLANLALGKRDEARAAFAKAVASPNDFPGKAEARQRLGELGGAPATKKG